LPLVVTALRSSPLVLPDKTPKTNGKESASVGSLAYPGGAIAWAWHRETFSAESFKKMRFR